MNSKEKILTAALSCFTEHAIEGTSIEMIRDASGTSVGSIYHHFKNKQGVVAALFVQGIHEYHEDLYKQLQTSKTAESGVRNIVTSYISWVAKNPEWARFVLYSREKIYEETAIKLIEDENREINARFNEWFKVHFDSGAIQKLPMEIFFALVLGPAQLYARRWVSGRAEQKNLLKYKTIFSQSAWLSVQA